ncbi:MAG: DUF763 domain-containing protein [Chitinophagales bacterium]
MRTGTADLPLHPGQCPAWLFVHMKQLCAAILEVIIEDEGPNEVLRRLSDPFWFQALGCVVGFDWHSSGVTTTVCGAIKEGMAEIGPRAGVYFAGGKGKTSRKTPKEIEAYAERYSLSSDPSKLVYASKMAAKVDNTAVQDGYDIYHHFFVFTNSGDWTVVQQGMNTDNKKARRYHWLSTEIKDFVLEPQTAICCNTRSDDVLNLVGRENDSLRESSWRLTEMSPDSIRKEIELIQVKHLNLPAGHSIPKMGYIDRSLRAAYESKPRDFEQLLQTPGVGPSTLRALCLVAEVAYGVKPSFVDPVRYSFAHGGKDGIPFPVNERDIENSYTVLRRALRKSRAGQGEQLRALRNLARWHSETAIGAISPVSPASLPDAVSVNTLPPPGSHKGCLKAEQPTLF